MLRNFEKFEVGHYYVYTGNERKPYWASNGQMDIVLKHNIMKCIKVGNYKTYANFEGYGEGVSDNVWSWEDGFDNWVEVESPDAIFEVGDSVLEYRKHYEHWQEVVIQVCKLTANKNVNSYDNGVFVYYICKRTPKVPTVKDSLVGKDDIVPIDKPPTINNLFKKYIRKKKYLTFSKEKKHTN